MAIIHICNSNSEWGSNFYLWESIVFPNFLIKRGGNFRGEFSSFLSYTDQSIFSKELFLIQMRIHSGAQD